MLALDIVFHTFFIFAIQSFLYIFIIGKLETKTVSNIVASNLKCLLYKYNPQYLSSLTAILPYIDLPQTCVSYDNSNWVKIIFISVALYFAFVIISILLVKLYFPDVNIWLILFKNFVIFSIIGIIEYFFFINIVLNYSELSFNDIQHSALQTLKTGQVQTNL